MKLFQLLFFSVDDKMPARVGHSIHENKDGSITFSYKPTETGTHEMNLSYNDKQAEGMLSLFFLIWFLKTHIQ